MAAPTPLTQLGLPQIALQTQPVPLFLDQPAVDLFEPLAHAIEFPGERADLISATNFDALLPLAFPNAPNALDQFLDGLRDVAPH